MFTAFSDAKQSKTAIYTNPRRQNKHIETIKGYLKVIDGILTPFDKLLVATYMDVVPLFEELSQYGDQVKFIYWGSKDARGSNDFKDFNKAMVIGWHRRPDHYYVSTVMANNQIDQYINSKGSVWADANHLKDLLIVDDMIQFFNRVRCRTAIDRNGNCRRVDLYCITGGNTKMEEVIKTSLESEMPNIAIRAWKPKELKAIKQKATTIEKRAGNFVRWLRGYIEKYEEISFGELRQEFGLKSSLVSKTINTDIFHDLLDEESITMIRGKGRGNGIRFILPKHKV